MRTIKQYMEAAKARKENGEAGFSLVELIVVVVILGILAAVAIPIFNGIQGKAEINAAQAAAANAAAEGTAKAAQGLDPTATLENEPFTVTVKGETGQVDTVCATAVHDTNSEATASSGPGC